MEISSEARKLHDQAVVIDGCSFFSHGWHERLERAGVTAMQMTVSWPSDDAEQALQRYHDYYRIVATDPKMVLVDTVADIRRCKREGKVGFILGSQNARMLGDDLGMVEIFRRAGARVIQLAYNVRNFIADGNLEASDAGLSRYGKAVVREMNRLGITVDLSHTGEWSTLEAMETSEKPCIFSHANARSVVKHPRNLTDAQIDACAKSGGVIGLTPLAVACWRGGPTPPTLDDFLAHLDYMVARAGFDHVAIGTDSEATPGAYPPVVRAFLSAQYPEVSSGYRAAFPATPRTAGFESMENLPNVTDALLRRGWSEAHVRQLLGENLLRVYEKTWVS